MRSATILNVLAVAAAASAHTIFQQISINGVAQTSKTRSGQLQLRIGIDC